MPRGHTPKLKEVKGKHAPPCPVHAVLRFVTAVCVILPILERASDTVLCGLRCDHKVSARYPLPCRHVSHVGLACCTKFNVVMSESKDSAGLGSTAAPGSLAAKPDSPPNTQSAKTTIDAASNQGYLSKLLGSGFGFGSGTGPSAMGRTPATVDEAHEYHPGDMEYMPLIVAAGDQFGVCVLLQKLPQLAELAFSPTDVGIWEPHSGQQFCCPAVWQHLTSVLKCAELALYRTSSSTINFNYYHHAARHQEIRYCKLWRLVACTPTVAFLMQSVLPFCNASCRQAPQSVCKLTHPPTSLQQLLALSSHKAC